MRFFKKILKKFARDEYIITESEIEKQLNAYDEYKKSNIEESTIMINKNCQFNEITNQVSNQIYKDNKYRVSMKNKYNNYECYNDYDMEEDLWTSIKAS